MMVDLLLMHLLGACLDPEIKLSKDLFKREMFVDTIMDFYTKVKGKPISTDFPLSKPVFTKGSKDF